VPSRNNAQPSAADIRQAFGRRLKELRTRLGYSQEEIAQSLGIGAARYCKYEIGRSEAPYEVLIKIARLTEVSLDFLIAGGKGESWSNPPAILQPLRRIVRALPVATAVYDASDRLVAYNDIYQRTFFPETPHVLRPGTPHEFVLRSWAYAQGHDPLITEKFVRERLRHPRGRTNQFELQVGESSLRIAESRHASYTIVQVTDLTSPQSGDQVE
jgi:transcriptional regulator with XRE-family HTH domain